MKRILIADASKASLVMTSEVFKDHFPGVQVVVARTSADAIEAAKSAGELDAFVIDYDLPDRDGAYTAARLKKQFTQPVLITAFDRLDVQENIDRELSAFDDCLSWIKKPVKPEMVVSLAQRFIEGKHRCQRRVDCSIPAFLEVELTPSASLSAMRADCSRLKTMEVARAKAVAQSPTGKKAVATGKKAVTTGKKAVTTGKKAVTTGKKAVTTGKKAVTTGKVAATGKAAKVETRSVKDVSEGKRISSKPATPVTFKPIRKIIPVLIDDVSLGGLKVRISNTDLTAMVQVKGKSVRMSCSFNEGQVLRVFVPPAPVIASGPEALEKWKKVQARRLSSEDFSGSRSTTNPLEPLGTRVSTLSSGTQLARSTLSKQSVEVPVSQGYPLQADVRWTASSESFTFCGLRSESVNTSKKLFEAMIEIELRTRSQLSPTVSPNTPRLSKLNA